MAYRVVLSDRYRREFRKLPREIQDRVRRRVRQLIDDPRGPGAKQRRGRPVRWQIRVGDYRVIYAIDDQLQEARVTTVDHRRDVNRRR